MKRSFANTYLIIIFICKIWVEENFTHYYHYKENFLEPLIALLCDVIINYSYLNINLIGGKFIGFVAFSLASKQLLGR